MNNYYFSPLTNGFYLDGVKTYIPEDVVVISEDLYLSLLKGQETGQEITVGAGGNPILIDQPLPTKNQLIVIANSQKANLIAEATVAIAPLQDAVDLGEATDNETSKLKSWKQYRVSVNRVDTSSIPNITWPDQPV